MRKLRFRVVGLFFVLLLATLPCQAIAQRLPAGVLIGKWCGENGDYVFTRQKLVVLMPDGSTREFAIARIVTGPDWVQVYWAGRPAVNGVAAIRCSTNSRPTGAR